MTHRSAFAGILAGLHPLPSPRGAALHLIRTAQREDASLEDVIRVARADPALTGRLIHAANRLEFSARAPTGALDVAVRRIGFCAVRQIALGFSLVGENLTGHCEGFDYADFWNAALLRGLAAQALAARFRTTDPSAAFVLGLLLDIGRLALATARPDAYAVLLQDPALSGVELRVVEKARFGIDHAELGALLAEQWLLPAESVNALRGYYQSSEPHVPMRFGRRSLFLADTIARVAIAPERAASAWMHIALSTADQSGIAPDELAALAQTVAVEASAWAPLLHLPLPNLRRRPFDAYPGTPFESPTAASGLATGPMPALEDLRVLLVDDDEDEHLLLRPVLEKHGCRVRTVNSADDALEAIVDASPDMVITDWQMPGMSGAELCRTLRQTRTGERLHLIIRTGKTRDEDLVAGIHAGANDFVSKHTADAILLARIQAGANTVGRCKARASAFAALTRQAADLAVLGLRG